MDALAAIRRERDRLKQDSVDRGIEFLKETQPEVIQYYVSPTSDLVFHEALTASAHELLKAIQGNDSASNNNNALVGTLLRAADELGYRIITTDMVNATDPAIKRSVLLIKAL